MRPARLVLAALLLFAAPLVRADELVGVVVAIGDGDTLRLLVEKREVKVRLDQIDAPERRQPFGERSRQSLAALAFRKAARVETHGIDRYGRTLGTVFVEGVDVNAEQVRRGMAWVYGRYAHDARLSTLQQQAQAAQRGLWADASPLPPWAWRLDHSSRRPGHSQKLFGQGQGVFD